MNDKERVLTNIIHQLYFTHLLFPPDQDFDDKVHFEHGGWSECKIKEGDLILGITNATHDWAIGFVHAIYDQNHLVIREIGTNRTCEVSNESFVIIRGMRDDELLDGDRHVFRRKVIKAFKWGDEMHRFNGLEFTDDGEAVIRVRFMWNVGEPFTIPIYDYQEYSRTYAGSWLWNQGVVVPPLHYGCCRKALIIYQGML